MDCSIRAWRTSEAARWCALKSGTPSWNLSTPFVRELGHSKGDGRQHEGPFCPEGALFLHPDSGTGSVTLRCRPWQSRWANCERPLQAFRPCENGSHSAESNGAGHSRSCTRCVQFQRWQQHFSCGPPPTQGLPNAGWGTTLSCTKATLFCRATYNSDRPGSTERRERDSNPRNGYKPFTRLAGERLRPLGHLSTAEQGR